MPPAPVGPDAAATATPEGARAHARAQEGAVAEAMPVLPAASWPDPPAGIAPERLVWAETVAGGGYTHRVLARGTSLRLTDVAGDACAHLLLYVADRPWERLNAADTVKVQWNAYLGAGKLLLSDMGRVLMSIVVDEAGTHDAFCGTSNAATNQAKYGEGRNSGAFPNGRDRLLLGSAKHGLQRRDVHPCVNLFKGTRIEGFPATAISLTVEAPERPMTRWAAPRRPAMSRKKGATSASTRASW